MKKSILSLLLLLAVMIRLTAQELPTALNEYKFSVVKKAGVTDVKNQFKSGTCWVYSANSFFDKTNRI
jgi:C1A family cysteine protease